MTGAMSVLGEKGDTKYLWDKNQADEVEVARRTFREFRDKGYQAFRAEGKEGTKGERIHDFDPAAERIIFVRPARGG